ncbi:MAG: hypothetical protein NTV00_14770 [Methylococcales bacterium]|nr:hypothetical protein [Methylococcales bacterium]
MIEKQRQQSHFTTVLILFLLKATRLSSQDRAASYRFNIINNEFLFGGIVNIEIPSIVILSFLKLPYIISITTEDVKH